MVDVSHYKKSKDKKALFTRAYNLQLLQCYIVNLPVPEPPVLDTPFSASISSEEDTDTDFDEAGISKETHFSNLQLIDDLIRNTELRKMQHFLLHD